jgi:nitrogen fixation protein FixH
MTQSSHPIDKTPLSSDYIPGGRPLNGWKALTIFCGLFSIVLIANGALSYFAIKSFSGEVIPHPYEHGLAYNREILAARAQNNRNWRVDVTLNKLSSDKTEISITARDKNGNMLQNLMFDAQVETPTSLAKDIRLSFEEKDPGHYVSDFSLPPGQRDLVLTARQSGEEVFRSHNRLHLR